MGLLLLLVFFGILLLMVGGYAFLNRKQLQQAEDSRARLLGLDTQPVSIFRQEQASGLSFLNKMLSGKSLTGTIANELRKAGSDRKPGEALLILVVAALVGFMIGQRGGIAFGIVFAILFAFVPVLLLRRKQAERIKKMEEQLPDALDMLVNSLRAGYSLQAAMEFVGRELAEPLGPEFARFYDEQRLGMEIRTALLRLEERVGTTDIRMFVTSLLIQRETGGNLGEVLGNLALLIRDRVAFRGHVKTLTAEPKISARVLAGLPFVAFLLFSMLNREYEKLLWTTPQGRMLALYGICSIAVGYFILSRIAKIEI